MSTFLCTNCGAVENTATSNYWVTVLEGKQPICSKCETGAWHNKFERKHWSHYGFENILMLQNKGHGDFINGREHLRNIGVIGSKKEVKKEIDWED